MDPRFQMSHLSQGTLHVSTMDCGRHNGSTGPLRLYNASLSHDHALSYPSLGEMVAKDPWVLEYVDQRC